MHWLRVSKKELSTMVTMLFVTIFINLYLNKSYGNFEMPLFESFNNEQVASIEEEQFFFKDCRELYFHYIDELAISLTNDRHLKLNINQFETFLALRSEYYKKLNQAPQNQKLLTYFTFKAEIEKIFGKEAMQRIMMVKNMVLLSKKTECVMEYAI